MAYENQRTEYRRFTEEEIAVARQTEIVAVAEAIGYRTKRVGKYYELQEHDSLRIFPNNTYCRFANVIDGKPETGSVIDFVMRYGGMEFREAVGWLLDYNGRGRRSEIRTEIRGGYTGEKAPIENPMEHTSGVQQENPSGSQAASVNQTEPDNQPERPEFRLPEPNDNNRRMYAYLCKTRGIPSNIVHDLWKRGLIYESKLHHNVVFVSRDADGEARHAFMRGTSGMFKCDVPGSDKLHFCFTIPAYGSQTNTVCVYEGAIDAISAKALDYLDRKTGTGEPWRVALGMLSDAPLEHFLLEHPEVRNIRFCMDRDFRGRNAVLGTAEKDGEPRQGGLLEKWKTAGYQVTDCPPKIEKEQGKDYNDLLILRMKAQGDSHTKEEYPQERTRESPFAEGRDRMLQRGQSGKSLNRYGQVVSVSGEREKGKSGGRNRNRGSGEAQKYCNRPSASYGYGYRKPKLRR